MKVLLTCKCGNKLKVDEELAGKRVQCPRCRAVFTVPFRTLDDEQPGTKSTSGKRPPVSEPSPGPEAGGGPGSSVPADASSAGSRTQFRIQRGTWVALSVVALVLIVLNVVVARKRVLTPFSDPRVTLNEQGLPLPAVRWLFSTRNPSQPNMFGLSDTEESFFPEGIRRDSSTGQVTFDNGAKIQVNVTGLTVDLLIAVLAPNQANLSC